ncbi:4-amino-4-deoxy-L-arabinose-phosphoundecaprenol flippase subunit ArnF [Pigmentiphaga humi]|uniref:4-amino-4-deoxy-L-arabinose-phosphoundecaprenol flippase subunit ArnF n=1 Tax=Pigmentiphaga humi TaxID=2478468 RepID=A0A3P4AYZ5_9BURK|nr:EamA family transporter [Pigmentiphaga humi]VCU69309.1 4-amino-4-deoxy-L-arabinose-phosphoundecaprenol flippase subunit ArnF [Pigmentiphaga humi]
MGRFYLIGFGLLMAFDTLAQVSFKLAANHAMPLAADLDWLLRVFGQPWIYGAFVGYVGAFFTWMALLKRAPIGPAFAASHLEVVTVMLASVWLFDEHIGTHQTVGAVLILAGIVCLAFGEAREAPADAGHGA